MTGDGIVLLDVGHGNCAVVHAADEVLIIDGGRGADLLQYLATAGIVRIATILVSHADSDHLKGVAALLATREFEVGSVYVNSDSSKDTEGWLAFAYELDDYQRDGSLNFETSLTEGQQFRVGDESLRIEVLAPRPRLVVLGPGARDEDGENITTNTISAVIRVWGGEIPLAVLAGDLDRVGLRHLLETGIDLRAPILVFPHHGGRASKSATDADTADFARAMAEAVRPETVVFSIGRGVHGNPRPEVVEAVRSVSASVRVACTQLSERCADRLPGTAPEHLLALHARGKRRNACCAGSLHISTSGSMGPAADEHIAFIESEAPSALCLRAPTSAR